MLSDIAKDRYIDGFHKSAAKIQIIFRICKYLNKKKIKQNVYILRIYSIKREFSILGYSSYGDPMVIL